MTEIEGLTIGVSADATAYKREIAECDKLARTFGTTMSRAFSNAASKGRSLTSALSGVSRQLSSSTLQAALKPMEGAVSTGIGDAFMGFKGLGDGVEAEAGLLSGSTPFARGGVVAAPTYFPLSPGRTGLMGEAGPEAILPLARTADGRLGVAASGGGRSSIVVNVTTSDADSFRRSEAEVTALLARAVSRGRRGT